MQAVEFFSGIGGFNQAARRCGIEAVAAFDQDAAANQTYELNYRLKPSYRNLEKISAAEIPSVDFWWLSPPCAPYTIRGARRDEKDLRAQSMLNLVTLIGKCKPSVIAVENVVGFGQSVVFQLLKTELAEQGYHCSELRLCPTQFGIPMQRPRLFIYAIRKDIYCSTEKIDPIFDGTIPMRPLSEFLMNESTDRLVIDSKIIERYGAGLNIIDPFEPAQRTICFTSGYGKSWRASGSLLRMNEGTVRRFAPTEILKLFGFVDDFSLPADLSLTKQWKLVGNSLEISSVVYVLRAIQNRIAEALRFAFRPV